MNGDRYLRPHRVPMRNVAAVYNQAGEDYAVYADGDPDRLFCFQGLHGYADRHLWWLLKRRLGELWAEGARSLAILDAGCGPGTWLRRVVTQAHRLGFANITTRGFDVSLMQIQTRSDQLSLEVTSLPKQCALGRALGAPACLIRNLYLPGP